MIVVCGDRYWTDRAMITRALAELPAETTIIQGGAKGADAIAAAVARQLGLSVLTCEADWEHWGRAAGPMRNQAMANFDGVSEVWAFHDDIEHSKGTKSMVDIAWKKGLPVRTFAHTSESVQQ